MLHQMLQHAVKVCRSEKVCMVVGILVLAILGTNNIVGKNSGIRWISEIVDVAMAPRDIGVLLRLAAVDLAARGRYCQPWYQTVGNRAFEWKDLGVLASTSAAVE